MKKIIYATIISLVTVLCVSATVADDANYSSSVTATIAGVAEDIDFDTKKLVTIYNLMPQMVEVLCSASYRDIVPKVEKSTGKTLYYEGIAIKTADGTDLKFTCGSHSVVVKNYNTRPAKPPGYTAWQFLVIFAKIFSETTHDTNSGNRQLHLRNNCTAIHRI